jgi:hypothetical protein
MRIGVISDTHVPDRTDHLPAEIMDIFAGVDRILHAGDIAEQPVLDRLQAIAPVTAVRGNRDHDRLSHLPEKLVIEAGAWRIGLIHGTRPRDSETGDRLRYLVGDHRFIDQRRALLDVFAADCVHCIVFGHTHQACNEVQDGALLFNPGGVLRSFAGGPSSVGLLHIDAYGITGQIVLLRDPPHMYSLASQIKRAAQR